MPFSGAEALRMRIEAQEHWRRAAAVRDGLQPPADPDGWALESFADDVRYYRPSHRVELHGGVRSVVISRMQKQLVDGAWDVRVERFG